MELLFKIARYSILFALLLMGYLFWAEETVIYKCEGEGRYSQSFIDEYESQFGEINNPYVSEVGFLKIQSSSKISLLFVEDRHYIWWERPNESIHFWGRIKEIGDQLHLYDFEGNFQGMFSKISKSFSFIENREFEGICQLVNN